MELVELALINFKKFADKRFSFSPGLNVVWGPNESGKSTTHEAISCALFGRERGRSLESWGGGPCSVELIYRFDEKLFHLERRIAERTVRLGVVTGSEPADIVSGKDEVAAILADHLGISSKQVFDNTVSVRQVHISRPGAAGLEAVGHEIQRVLTGTANVSAAEALKRLEAGRDAIKGRARPTNPREYDRIAERLTRLASELADARRSRDQIRNLEEELAELEVRIRRDSERSGALEALLERHRRWAELKKNEEEADDHHRDVFGTVKRLKDTFANLAHTQKELAGYAHLVDKDAEIADHLSKISGRRGELESRLDDLGSAEEESRPVAGPAAIILFTAALMLAVAGLVLGSVLNPRALWLLAPSAVLIIAGYARLRIAGRAAGLRHLAELIDSARSELKQLDAEEESILSYIKCQDTEKAWARLKSYRSLASQAHELEVTLNALLAGRNLSDLEVQEAELHRKLSGIRRELEDGFSDYSPTTEEAESWRSEFTALQHSLPSAQARLHEVLGSLDAERRNARDLAALEGEIEFLHRRKDELEFLYKAYDEAIAALNAVTQAVSEEYLPTLSEWAGEHMSRVTSGRYTSVCVKPGWEIGIDCRERKSIRPSSLSVGTVDQLYLALRLACGEILSEGRKLPIILDDPFASFDRERLNNALGLLEKLAAGSQIIFFTHDPYVLDWALKLAESNAARCLVHNLERLSAAIG